VLLAAGLLRGDATLAAVIVWQPAEGVDVLVHRLEGDVHALG